MQHALGGGCICYCCGDDGLPYEAKEAKEAWRVVGVIALEVLRTYELWRG